MKRFILLLTNVLALVLAIWLGYSLAIPKRTIETNRMETCLELYAKYRKDLNQEELAQGLQEISLTPKDFQIIIDKFIYYRSRKSSLKQAMDLLSGFERGFNIKVDKIETITGMDNEPFRLDAEVLSVFQNKPDLIEKAFSS